MLNKQSTLPLYTQVEQFLKEEIKSGGYHTGDFVPSERELSEKFQISRMTVRQAINNMVHNGELYRERGKGTFVAAPKLTYPLKGIFSFTEDMERKGLKPSTKVISLTTVSNAPNHILGNLQCDRNAKVVQLKRIRLANEKPVAVETAYLPYEMFSSLTEWEASGSIYTYVRQTLKKNIHRASQQIEASIAGEHDSSLLDIQTGSPVLIVNRTTYLHTGEPFETVQTVFRGDQYTFSIEMEHGSEDEDVLPRN
ncbi:GntR family transcriptional regulator [Pseudalkalibacillus berkeleyi]|uniref:GntR family transcriptional regulator n=1 Tax=Pseudalkalibacillus berkeleyi TaxID=1069813 RepID=A0ABS9H172_9BACL|nr:GntR family transcriptional regulator [Pseudalkalibacillus berkeleyi]MCF6137771.1 GntR family transcriptional regulator [Pseudalkalibacillus berkeleyi]